MSYIGLMDCNNFFVSCERLFRPDLWGKPVAVLSSNDGVIVARSNELKAMGVPMGLPLFQAKKLVDMDNVTLFSSNFTLYRDISSRVMKTLSLEVGECEVYSVDEAFFKVSDKTTESELVDLRTRIMQKVGIPVSIGVASTKTLAKVGSELGKKGGVGVCLLTKDKWQKVAETYPCGDVWNLGRATTKKLSEVGVKTAAEFKDLDSAYVQKRFGIGGRRVQEELSGKSVHKIGGNSSETQQSIMSTRSFSDTTNIKSELESALSYHIAHVAEKLREKKLLTDKLLVIARASRHSNFNLREGSTSVTLEEPTNDTTKLLKATLTGLDSLYDKEIPYKKVGVTASSLLPEAYRQTSLFTENENKTTAIDSVRDEINNRFGNGSLKPAIVLSDGPKTSVKLRSNEYPTSWGDIPNVVAK